MTIKSSAFTSLSGDRRYLPDVYARRFREFFTDGVIVDGGGPITTELEVSVVGGNLQTSVAIGTANVQGYDVLIEDAPEILTHDAADAVNDRIDRVVVEISRETNRIGDVKILKGTPAVTPVAPTLLRDATDFYQLSLSQVLVQALATILVGGDLTDEREDSAVCGISNANVGITPPAGNSAAAVTVDDTNIQVLDTTSQQTFDDDVDSKIVELQWIGRLW